MQTDMRTLRLLGACILLIFLAACSTGKGRGGYYKDDGPEANPPSNLDSVPDAVPKIEPLASGANKPYTVFGRQYVPDVTGGPYRVQGRASWYGRKFHGNSTSNGERYNMYAMTAAHPTLPIPSYVRVTRVTSGKFVVLRINDRGPFHSDRVIDLSYVAAYKLGMLGPGSTEVVVERIMPDQIRNWASQPAPAAAQALPIVPATTPAAPAAIPAVPLPGIAQTAASAGESTFAAAVAGAAGISSANATQPPARSTPSNGTPVPPGAMFLQLGAFSEPARAQSLAARVTEQISTTPGATVQVDVNASNLYRVRIGPYAGRDAALEALTSVQSATGMTPSLSLP